MAKADHSISLSCGEMSGAFLNSPLNWRRRVMVIGRQHSKESPKLPLIPWRRRCRRGLAECSQRGHNEYLPCDGIERDLSG